MDTPRTLQAAIIYFSDPDRAFQYAILFRWPDGLVTCPRCGSENHSFIKTRRIWFCYGCKKQFSLKIGTIFEDSAITLDKWMMVMWMVANCKNGVSSYEIAKAIGITQKSAWFMLHRIRRTMHDDETDRLGGGPDNPVEVDETYIGGKPKNMHASRRLKLKLGMNGYAEKATVMGMLARGTREIRAKVVPNAKRETLQAEILNHVGTGSTVYTDGWAGYDNLAAKEFIHDTVNHMEEYVRGQVHTQGIENFWSLLKRTLTGTYVAVEPCHLGRYVDEQVFRYNNRRNLDDGQRFNKVLSQVAGKRLTYAELTGADAF